MELRRQHVQGNRPVLCRALQHLQLPGRFPRFRRVDIASDCPGSSKCYPFAFPYLVIAFSFEGVAQLAHLLTSS